MICINVDSKLNIFRVLHTPTYVDIVLYLFGVELSDWFITNPYLGLLWT